MSVLGTYDYEAKLKQAKVNTSVVVTKANGFTILKKLRIHLHPINLIFHVSTMLGCISHPLSEIHSRTRNCGIV